MELVMKRILLALAIIVGLAAPAYATEINTDVGCDTPGAWSPGTGWSVTGSKCVASSATRMSMLMQMNSLIKKNHDYKVTFTVSGVSGSGKLRAFVGVQMPSAPVGTNILASSVSAVADNFTTSLGLTTSSGAVRSLTGPGDDPERNGSMRITCVSGGFGRVDPLVYPGLQAPHTHEFVGASNIGRNWTFNDFRTKAQSSCTNIYDPTHTINRSGYWFPAVIDGNGNYKRTAPMLIYYKGPSSPSQPATVALTGSISGTTLTVTATGGVTNPISPDGEFITGTGITANTQIMSQLSGTTGGIGTYQLNNSMTVGSETITLISPYKNAGETSGTAASMCADFSPTVTCQNVPRGLRFTFGYKGSFNATASTDNNCGPDDAVSVGSPTTERCSIQGLANGWQCDGGPNSEGAAPGVAYTATYNTLHEIMAANVCVVGSWANRAIGMPSCWDGTYVDTPDHRSHISWGNDTAHCLAAHPVKLPQISLLLSYRVDSTFLAGQWHLSSDEMAACYDTSGLAGCTEHADYWEAWSDSVRDTWYAHCNNAHNSCTNDLGDGTSLKAGTGDAFGNANGPIFGSQYQMNDKTPPENFGMSRDITANGTYTVYLRSPDDGVWGFMGLKSFSGSVDSISVTDLGPAAKGPVTVHN
jgi:hypothetical protein